MNLRTDERTQVKGAEPMTSPAGAADPPDDHRARSRNGLADRFVALGDSFTEGVGDEVDGTPRGWADLVARVLQDRNPGFGYANLAVRGKLLGQILDEQLDAGIALRPDLVCLAAGGNDMLRPRVDLPSLIRLLDMAVARLVDAGAEVVIFTGADPFDRLPMTGLLRAHAGAFCDGLRQVAQRRRVNLVDLWAHHELGDARFWSEDRLHLNAAGHRRVAALVLAQLGLAAPADWTGPVDPLPALAHPHLAQARYYSDFVAPWVKRRLTGRSSGDGRGAKRPDLAPVLARDR